MTLFGLFKSNINGEVDTGFPFGFEDFSTNFRIEFLPDIFAGTTGNDNITGDLGGPNVIFNLDISVDSIPDPDNRNISLPNTARDFIVGFGGNDNLVGDNSFSGGGNDIILGDAFAPNDQGLDGDDTLDGLGGNDVLIGGGGGDLLLGFDGDDIMLGDYFLRQIQVNFFIDTEDFLPNDKEDDVNIYNPDPIQFFIGNFFNESEGNDTLFGENGDDLLIGDRGDDSLNGGNDQDTLLGFGGFDNLNGGEGSDIILGDGVSFNGQGGGFNNDTLDGAGGDDIVIGGGASDVLSGGDGNDILLGICFRIN